MRNSRKTNFGDTQTLEIKPLERLTIWKDKTLEMKTLKRQNLEIKFLQDKILK